MWRSARRRRAGAGTLSSTPWITRRRIFIASSATKSPARLPIGTRTVTPSSISLSGWTLRGSDRRSSRMTQPWQPERDVSPELAAQLINEQFPQLVPARLELLGIGWDNIAFVVNDEYVF